MNNIQQKSFYVVKQKSTGMFLSNYDTHLNDVFFDAASVNDATWISGKCINGIHDRYLINIKDEIEIIEAPARRDCF